MRLDLPGIWSSPRARHVRGGLILVAATLATLGYASFLDRGYPLRTWLFWQVGALWAWGLFLSVACVSFGHLVLTRLFRMDRLPVLETVVHSAALGLLGFVLGMYAGGFLHLFNRVFAVLLPAAMLASGALPLARFIRERRAAFELSPRRGPDEGEPAPIADTLRSALTVLAVIFGVIGALSVYLGALTPEAINFDSSWSHIPIAADYARAGKIVPFPADYTRNVPHLASIVHTWAFLVPGLGPVDLRWMMAQHLEFFWFLWTLASVAAMARWLLGEDEAEPGAPPSPPPARATWAAFFLFPAIFVYDNNLGGGADHYLAVFAPPFFLAAVRAMRRFDRRQSALAGTLAAGALLAKYQAIYLIFGIGLLLLGAFLRFALMHLRARRNARKGLPAAPETADSPPPWRELVVGPLCLIGALALVSSPHFLKNLAFYRNPVYPFAQDIFTRSTPTTPNASYLFEWLFKDYNWRPDGTLLQNIGSSLRLCFTFSFEPHYSFTHGVPNTGSLFTLTLPFLFFLRAPRRLWLGAIAGLGALFLWAMTFRVDRHLQTFIPLLVASTAAVLVRSWDMGWLARIGLIPLVALQVIWGGDAFVYSGQSRIKAAIDLLRSGYEGKRKDSERFTARSDFKAIGEALPKDAKVILHHYRPNLGIDRDIYLDWAGQQGLILYEGLHGPRGIYDYWRSLGMTHILHLPGHHIAPTVHEDVIFNHFINRYGKGRRRFGGIELVEIPAEPPPPDAPYFVLAAGIGGYKDGLYPVESMKTYDGMPKAMHKYAPPEVPLPRDAEAQKALLARATAVVQGAKPGLDPTVKAAIDAEFSSVASYARGYTVLVRKSGAATPAPQGPAPRAPGPEGEPTEQEEP